MEARWRYLLRNPDFRADLREVLTLRSTWWAPNIASYEVHKKFFDLQTKWQFSGVSIYALREAPKLTLDSIQHFEALFDPEGAFEPVSVIYDQDGETSLDAQTLGDPRRLFLEIDLQYPRDVLLSLIEEQLRNALEEREPIPSNVPRKRRRLDKVDFYLKVYDLAESAETFDAIAKAVNRRPSTVKSAFLAARRNIFGLAPIPSESSREPTKKELPLVDLDRDTHPQRCKVCQAAKRFEDMCPQARLYGLQDHVSQRSWTGFDTVRDAPDSTPPEEDGLDDLLDSEDPAR